MEATKTSKRVFPTKVHGTFNSFADLAAALNIKGRPPKEEKAKVCRKCGTEMVKVAGNVWICPHSEVVTEKQVKDGVEKEVQVVKECGNRLIARQYT